jgi:hypothetical protein
MILPEHRRHRSLAKITRRGSMHLARFLEELVLASFLLARYLGRVPKDAFTLTDVREPTLTVVCQPCGRRGRYNVERLIAKHGDAKILFLLSLLTNCPQSESANIYDRCKARYEGLSAW